MTSEEVGRANGVYTVAQQLSMALGVAMAALTLEASQFLRGGSQLESSDFSVAFLVAAAIGLISTAFYMRLPVSAGANLSGHVAA